MSSSLGDFYRVLGPEQKQEATLMEDSPTNDTWQWEQEPFQAEKDSWMS